MSKKTGLLPSSDRRDAGCATASLRALFELVAARPNCSGREPPVTAHGQRRLARKGPESGPSQWRRRPRVRPGNLCCELHERETSLSPRSPCTELSPEALAHFQGSPPKNSESEKTQNSLMRYREALLTFHRESKRARYSKKKAAASQHPRAL